MNLWRIGLQLKLFLLVQFFTAQLHAASLAVWPINPRIDAPDSATMVWVKNSSAKEEMVLQARIFSWRQENNKDYYDAQDDLVVSPPLITVKPGTQQVFRVVNRKGAIADVAQEASYRLIIDEIPVSTKLDGAALNFQMRYSLPLFVGMPIAHQKKSPIERHNELADSLHYRLLSEPEKILEVTNTGKLNVRLSKVKISLADAQPSVQISEGLLGYVLVGASRQWPLTAAQWDALQRKDARVLFEQEHQELEIAAQ